MDIKNKEYKNIEDLKSSNYKNFEKKFFTIEGEFRISKDKKHFFIDNEELKDNDIVHLKVKQLKEIIKDVIQYY